MRRAAIVATGITLLAIVAVAISGAILFAQAPSDPLRRVDAVVVLGGEHDGREEYGLSLVRAGVAPVLVLSNPYPQNDPVMRRICGGDYDGFDVLCRRPVPSTTRGEAILARDLAAAHGWRSVIVVSWRFHLPRTRLIFQRCFAGSVVMRAVPREYRYSMVRWEYTYIYQYAAIVKSMVQGACGK